jgi:hypothetical protein
MKMNPKMKRRAFRDTTTFATSSRASTMHHLPMPRNLQSNISHHDYESARRIFVKDDVLAPGAFSLLTDRQPNSMFNLQV